MILPKPHTLFFFHPGLISGQGQNSTTVAAGLVPCSALRSSSPSRVGASLVWSFCFPVFDLCPYFGSTSFLRKSAPQVSLLGTLLPENIFRLPSHYFAVWLQLNIKNKPYSEFKGIQPSSLSFPCFSWQVHCHSFSWLCELLFLVFWNFKTVGVTWVLSYCVSTQRLC